MNWRSPSFLLLDLLLLGALLCGIELALPAPAGPTPPQFQTLPSAQAPERRLLSQLPGAAVRTLSNQKPTPLSWKGAALSHRRLPAWNWVGPLVASVPLAPDSPLRNWLPTFGAKAETLCIWAHPPKQGAVSLEWPAVPPGSLVGYLHFLPSANAESGIKLTVSWGRKTIVTLRPKTQPGKSAEFEANLEGPDPQLLTISVETTTAGRNHVCLDGVLSTSPLESR